MVHFLLFAVSALLAYPLALSAHPLHLHTRDEGVSGHVHGRATTPELDLLFEGNKQFRASDPALLKKLTDDGQGQSESSITRSTPQCLTIFESCYIAPPFMFIGCSDSRASEGTIFNAKPGTFFTERNIANQFHSTDANG
jgi:carbonic anhydrase